MPRSRARRAGRHQLPGLHRRLLLDRARSRPGAPRADGRPRPDQSRGPDGDRRLRRQLARDAAELVELELRAGAGVQEGDRPAGPRPAAHLRAPELPGRSGRSASRNHRPWLAGRQSPRRPRALLRPAPRRADLERGLGGLRHAARFRRPARAQGGDPALGWLAVGHRRVRHPRVRAHLPRAGSRARRRPLRAARRHRQSARLHALHRRRPRTWTATSPATSRSPRRRSRVR